MTTTMLVSRKKRDGFFIVTARTCDDQAIITMEITMNITGETIFITKSRAEQARSE
jgi:hypothetical protein